MAVKLNSRLQQRSSVIRGVLERPRMNEHLVAAATDSRSDGAPDQAPDLTTDLAPEFLPARLLGHAHAQTIWPYFMRRLPQLPTVREVWDLPDGDVLDVVRLPERPGQPLVLLLHGLEGSADAPYVRGMFSVLHREGWNAVAISMPSCGPSPSRHGRLYHSGKTDEVDLVMERLAARYPDVPRGAVGFSMGGNMLFKWLGERGDTAPVTAAVGLSVPFDLGVCARGLDGPGFFSFVYRERFLRSLRRKARRTLEAHGGPYTRE